MFAEGDIQLSIVVQLHASAMAHHPVRIKLTLSNDICPIRSINYSCPPPGALATTRWGKPTITVDEADTETRTLCSNAIKCDAVNSTRQ
jgi:hypothetical protein